MDRKECEIVDDVMGAVEQTEAWREMYNSDNDIAHQEAALDLLLDRIPAEDRTEIHEAFVALEDSIIRLAMLYGMRVMWSMNRVWSNPSDFSQYLLNHREH